MSSNPRKLLILTQTVDIEGADSQANISASATARTIANEKSINIVYEDVKWDQIILKEDGWLLCAEILFFDILA
jgi:hypothetical protein